MQVYNINELSKILQMHRSILYRDRKRGLIKGSLVAGKLLFTDRDIEKYLENTRS
jgi:predicted site-specific integrase-resolvase